MIRIKDLKVPVNDDNIQKYLLKKEKIDSKNIIEYEVLKKSIDARSKDNIYYIYDLSVSLKNENNSKYPKYEPQEFTFSITGTKELNKPIIIVGAGPAGLFCAYNLSLNGYKVILFERGKMVEERKKDVEDFWQNNKLNLNSNVQFGEGGAGTFSDGKLNTMVKDPFNIGKKVLSTFVENGANSEIVYLNKPHLGTDVLFRIIQNMRKKIQDNGGQIFYNSCLTDIKISNNKVRGIIINNNDYYETDNLVLAIGNSARDTFKLLNEKNVSMECKGFAIGVRIMHDQSMINENQYGKFAKYLGSADYKLTYKASNNRGVYTFCNCPGGYVINASSLEDKLCINGMSYSKRDSNVSNSAIVVTLNPSDFDNDITKAINFQNNIEHLAYELGHGNIPIQTYKDFKENNVLNTNGNILKIKGNYFFADLNDIFPIFVNNALKEAIDNFGKKIKGFNDDDVILAAVESRTSCPIRTIRDEKFMTNIEGVYAIGEGAGYAGGITTSAIDGIKMADIFMKEYKNNN